VAVVASVTSMATVPALAALAALAVLAVVVAVGQALADVSHVARLGPLAWKIKKTAVERCHSSVISLRPARSRMIGG
jgi:hypothetical protein